MGRYSVYTVVIVADEHLLAGAETFNYTIPYYKRC